MLINLSTLNVRGLNDPMKTLRLRNYIKAAQPSIDTLLIQEHKLTGDKALRLGKALDSRAIYLHSDAEPGYNHAQGTNGAGCGGSAILIANKWEKAIASSGSCFKGRALWVILTNLPGGDLGILNIYSPNDQHDRIMLWQELGLTLPRNYRWILGGDFNMVENPSDKSSQCGRLIGTQERFLFDTLKENLNVADFFQGGRGLKFSWDNGRSQNQRILARLDRFYIFNNPGLGHSRDIVAYTIQSDSTLSDHHPVNLQLSLGNSPKKKGCWKMNVRFLDETKEDVEKLWKSMATSRYSFFTKICKITRFYRGFYVKKAAEFKASEEALRNELSAAQAQLQLDPFSGRWQLAVATVKERLTALEKHKSEGIRIRARLKWKEKGDWGSKEFFDMVSEKPKSTVITQLKDSQGSIVYDDSGLNEVCWKYYSNLYESPSLQPSASDLDHVLNLIPTRFTEHMCASLSRPLTSHELHAAALKIAKDRAPGPDGISVQFYVKFWYLIGEEFKEMIDKALANRCLPQGMTQGLISLIFKSGDQSDLGNWRPITLLNTSYKILAKALQLRLQPMLPEIIDPDQTAFVPMRYILDNILVTHETIDHAKCSKQDLVFLKLDYRKAFDRIDWNFLFLGLKHLGLLEAYIDLVKLLFTGATVRVNINQGHTKTFRLARGVRQGCPLAPYLFILVQEILNNMVKKSESEDKIRGILLPGSNKTQLISQFADDTSFTIAASRREYVTNLVEALTLFNRVSGLEINWTKSLAYWYSPGPRPQWLHQHDWKWAQEHELVKMLGTPFGMDLSTEEIDSFLLQKVQKKLSYWTSSYLSLSGRATILNQVLLATIWYFVAAWGGSSKVYGKITALLRNYLWAGKDSRTRTRVSWQDCCIKRKLGGLSLIDPKEAEVGLLSKWVVHAFLPGDSNLQTILRNKLSMMSPSRVSRWPRDPSWSLVTHHTPSPGSRIWNRIQRAWNRMGKHLREGRPLCEADTAALPLWWNTKFTAGSYDISHVKALELYSKGLRTIGDLWCPISKQFKNISDLQRDYGLNQEDSRRLAHMIVDLDLKHRFYLETPNSTIFMESWVGGFTAENEDHPTFLFRTSQDWDPPSLHLTDTLKNPPPFIDIYTVGKRSSYLIRSDDPALRERLRHWSGIFSQARVAEVKNNDRRQGLYVYCGRPGRIKGLDPIHWMWRDGSPFFHYSAKRGREMLNASTQLKKPIAEKWQSERIVDFPMRWEDPWHPQRNKKEGGFMWSIWHQAVATNTWRKRFTGGDMKCVCCNSNADETYTHRFYECRQARLVWTFGFSIIQRLQRAPGRYLPFPALTFEQCIFAKDVRFRLNSVKKIWFLIRGIALWCIWLARNDVVFNKVFWTEQRIHMHIWEQLLDYGRLEWAKTLKKLGSAPPEQHSNFLHSFDSVWTRRKLMCSRSGSSVRWHLLPPSNLLISW
jgi:exonuclease III